MERRHVRHTHFLRDPTRTAAKAERQEEMHDVQTVKSLFKNRPVRKAERCAVNMENRIERTKTSCGNHKFVRVLFSGGNNSHFVTSRAKISRKTGG